MMLCIKQYIGERKDRTAEQMSDEDYKVAPTSTDKEYLESRKAKATDGNYRLSEHGK